MASVYVVLAELFDGSDEILCVTPSSDTAERSYYDERYSREGDGDTDVVRLEAWKDGKKIDEECRYSFLNDSSYDYDDWEDYDEEDLENDEDEVD